MIVKLHNHIGKNLARAIEEFIGKGKLNFACNGNGICNLCKVKILEGSVFCDGRIYKNPEEVLSCKSEILTNCTVEIADRAFSTIKNIADDFVIDFPIEIALDEGFSVALDIGTTTLALIYFENKTGKIIQRKSKINSQISYADNLIDRIAFCQKTENLELLHNLIIADIESLLTQFNSKFSRMFISANTTMLHIFCKKSPTTLGKSPFKAEFLDCVRLSSKNFFKSLNEFEINLLASTSAFIGADVVSGLIASNFENAKGNAIFIDIGTNGEIVVKKDNQFYACSAATGAVFEGFILKNGIRAVDGAISKISINEDFAVKFSTISDKSPIGICGSAYIDFLAQARKVSLIQESGRFVENSLIEKIGKYKSFRISENIYIDEEDIANLLKAKAALHSAIITLIDSENIDINSIANIYIAGGFGKNLDYKNAVMCGLIPNFKGKIHCIANSSLAGAYLSALNNDYYIKESNLSKKIVTIHLNNIETFEDNYIDSMFL